MVDLDPNDLPITDTGAPAIGGLVSTARFGRLPDGREVVVKRAGDRVGALEELAHEAAVLHLLAGRCRAPAVVAEGPDVLVLERLTGRVELSAWSPRLRDRYVRMLGEIHDLDGAVAEVLEPWSTWVEPDAEPPDWSADPGLWAEAIELAGSEPPPARAVFCHRDIHPGNVLVDGADPRITGVIDWGAAVAAPAAVDLAHLAHNLACLHGVDTARDMVAAYRVAAQRRGVAVDDLDDPYWWAHEILSWLPDPAHILPPWSPARPDLTAPLVRRRSQDLLRWALAR
ncbi:phosphotransferase family protein [Millisia brevis]|uniref:phosphotransferase family protein n=1 Tax=Millisia brevis TaxID=264148 RepID=UPI000A9A2AC1|nr:aminoglycoside phosphotransferase family protein [Millisia brevis]